MPLPSDHLPPTPQSLWQAIKDLRRDLQELRAARRLEAAAIGAGGLQITAGGTFSVRTPTGVQTVLIGNTPPNHADGTPQQGIIIRREDGSQALSVWNSAGTGVQPVQVWDKAGHIIMADDLVAGGLARPWVAYTAPTDENISNWPRTAAGSWTTIARSRGITQHPRVKVRAAIGADGTAVGQIRLCVDGTPVATGGLGAELNTTVSLPAFVHMNEVEFTLQAQVTSGSGSVYAMTRYLYGVQS